MEMQRRNNQVDFITRSDEQGDPHISGRFICFDSRAELFPGYFETIAKDVEIENFDGDIRALIDHESRLCLGRTRAGTLMLVRTENGVEADIKINPNDSDAMNLHSRVIRGDISSASFGFTIPDGGQEFTYRDDGTVDCLIRKIKLYEVSVVTFPVYDETDVSARKAEIEGNKKTRLDAMKKASIEKLKGALKRC